MCGHCEFILVLGESAHRHVLLSSNVGLLFIMGGRFLPDVLVVLVPSCGVGVLASPGIAVAPLDHATPAWKWIYAMSLFHGVFVAPRPGSCRY